MEYIKGIVRLTTIFIAVCVYICIWISIGFNYDMCYTPRRWEKVLSIFYSIWIIGHILLLIGASVWAWI
jgi:hypothetical protein